jgi:hypothetical protein
MLNDEGANQKTGGWHGQKERRPIRVFDGREHHRKNQDQRDQRGDELLGGETGHRAAIFLAVCSQAAHPLLLRLRHRFRLDDRRQSRIVSAKLGAALRTERLL